MRWVTAMALLAALGCTGLIDPDPEATHTVPTEGIELVLRLEVEDVVRAEIAQDARRLQLLLGSDHGVRVGSDAAGPALVVEDDLLGSRAPPSVLERYERAQGAAAAASAPSAPLTYTPQAAVVVPEATVSIWSLRAEVRAEVEEAGRSRAIEVLTGRLSARGVPAFDVQAGAGPGEVIVRLGADAPIEATSTLLLAPGELSLLFEHDEARADTVADLVIAARAQASLDDRLDERALDRRLHQQGLLASDQRLVWERVAGQEPTPRLADARSVLGNDEVEDAEVFVDDTGGVGVSLGFTKQGAKAFGNATTAHVGDVLLVVVDGEVLSAPVIREPITGGTARLLLGQGATRAEAERLAALLETPALPEPLVLAETRTFP